VHIYGIYVGNKVKISKTNKIIDSNPASYPRTSTPEYDSVVTLIHILNKGRVKFDLNILDKVPNTDGIFELVTENQIPIGKLDIQIKKVYFCLTFLN